MVMRIQLDRGRWRSRLVSRLTWAFVVPTAVVAAVATAIAVLEIRGTVRGAAYDRLTAATAVREAQFDRWTDEEANDLRFVTATPTVGAAVNALARSPDPARSAALSRELAATVASQRDFTRIVILSAHDGRVLGASDPRLLTAPRAADRATLGARDGVHVLTLDSASASAGPSLTVAVPVTSAEGVVIAIIAGDANLGRVDDLIDERSGLGRTGEAFLVNAFHEVLRAGGDLGRPVRQRVAAPVIDRALAGESGEGVYVNYAGREVVGVYRWLPESGLALFAEMTTDEAFSRARRLAWEMIAFSLLAIGALALGLTFVARRIARPILEVTDAARRVAHGDLAATAPAQTSDEIGELATAFNVMTSRLQEMQRETTAQIHAAGQAARDSEASSHLLRAVIDHLPALVAVKGLDGNYLIVNSAFGAVYDIAPDRLLGRSAAVMVTPDEAAGIAAADEEVIRTGRMIVAERVQPTRSGDRTYLTARFPLLDAEGEVFGVGVVATDITERKRLELQILHQQKLEAVGRLAGGVAHDMNNLLTAVRCNAELVLETLAPDHPDRQPLEEIERSVRNGSALTRQLLTFSRAHVVRPSALDVNRILGGMAAMLRRYVGTGIDMRFDLADDLWTVQADEGQMEQVLLNLLSNAHDAMNRGGTATVATRNVVVGGPAGVTVPGLAAGEYVVLAVSDTGSGIEPDVIPLLFEPFFTTKEAGRGTGLGLSTAYAIVQQARGAITVDSVVGAGTTFGVYLPRHSDDSVSATAAVPPRVIADSGELLLVVDDDPAVRTALRRMLALQGYRILEAQSGHDALSLLGAHGSDVAMLLTDVFMPEMSGNELAAVVRERHPALPVVFMSGYTASEIVRRGLMHAETSFLQKPFTRKVLLDLVAGTLRRTP